MLREKFWYQLQREPTQSFESWISTVKERAAECKFPSEFQEQAVRDKITFSCSDDRAKLKLYDEGANLSLDKAMTILSMKEATSRELQETKTATIETIRQRPAQSSETTYQKPIAPQQKLPPNRCGYCGKTHPRGRTNCPAANVRCNSCNKLGHFSIVCRSSANNARVNQVTNEEQSSCSDRNQAFIGAVHTRNQLPKKNPNK